MHFAVLKSKNHFQFGIKQIYEIRHLYWNEISFRIFVESAFITPKVLNHW